MRRHVLFGAVARAVVVAGLIGCGQIAAAQGTNKASPAQSRAAGDGLDDIIVTARKITERLQDAPVAVTTLTANVLEERGIRDLSETVKLASSVKFDSDADVRAGVAIRGVGQSADVNAAPGVGMFIDGVYQPSSAYYTVPFFDAQRIEILKGPQGTLYGKNTMGGAISIISREPGDHMAGSISVEGSSNAQFVGNAAIDTPIAGDTFGNRTSVFYRYSEGLQTNRTTGEHADQRTDLAIRSRFVLKPSSNFKSSLTLFYADLESTPFSYSATNLGLNNPIDNVTKGINGQIISTYKSANLTNTLDLGAAVLTALTSYDNAHVTTLADADFTATNALRVSGILDRDTFAQELRLASSGEKDSKLRWLVGGYYSDDRVRSNSTSDAFLFGSYRPLSIGTKYETGKTYAGFGQLTLTLDKLELVAGLRYDEETRHNISQNQAVFPPPTKTTNSNSFVTSKAWQPKVSASYHFSDDVMGYALFSRGFRAGGFNAITAPAPFTAYMPEKTTTYEAGLKTELFDRHLRFNTALFYTDYTDIIQNDLVVGTDGGNVVVSKNGGKARSYGVEIDVAYRVTRELTLAGGYTYLDIKNNVIPAGAIRREASGFAPHVFNLQADYRRSLNQDWTLGAHVSASYTGSTPMATEVVWRDAHVVTDASIDLGYKTFTIALFGKNVFNEKFYNSYIPAAQTIAKTSSLGLLNRPAEYGVRLSTKF